MATIEEVVGALKYLETKFGAPPSVAEVAEQVGISSATAHKHLKRASKKGLIVQRKGQFMTNRIARAFEEKGDDQ